MGEIFCPTQDSQPSVPVLFATIEIYGRWRTICASEYIALVEACAFM